jgi:chemotaxis regulatin CheY-phosphate phosphatase CheZ
LKWKDRKRINELLSKRIGQKADELTEILREFRADQARRNREANLHDISDFGDRLGEH